MSGSHEQSRRARSASGGQEALSGFLRMRFDAFELDEANARLLRDAHPVALAPRPFAVLCTLVRQLGFLITKNDLLDTVWGHRFVSDSVLKTAISELRTALEDDARRPRYVETVSRRGYRFIGVPTAVPAHSPAASPSVAGLPQTPSLIGRAHALARLRAAWDLACSGKRTLVWVAGDPGIGKTTLIDHFVSALGEVTIARGQCVEQHGTGEPYLPILEALAELCRRDNTVLPLLRAVAPTWLLQLPWLNTPEERDALRRELAGALQDRMLREMGELLDRCTQQRPLLLVTEDLHWSDNATIQLMDHIARRRGNSRLMWVASFRLDEVIAYDYPLKTLRNELRLHGLCDEIVLDPFSEKEVAEYVARRAPSMAATDTFVRSLHARTDGLPLFVTHVMDDLIAHWKAADREARTSLLPGRMAIPENLAAIIDQYIARLVPEQRAVLEAAAVCGVEFRVGTVAAVLERDTASVAAICDELARGHLWLSAPADDANNARDLPYFFRHALFRQWLCERTGRLARTRLHGKVGAALELERAAGVPVTAAELAMHFECGREPMAAVRYLRRGCQSRRCCASARRTH